MLKSLQRPTQGCRSHPNNVMAPKGTDMQQDKKFHQRSAHWKILMNHQLYDKQGN